MASSASDVPYWRVNVPEKDWPETCPDFLTNITDKQKRILATNDANYHILSWDEVKDVVKKNQLDVFQRVPTDLRRYLQYMFKIKNEWGSIMNFVLKERIRWTDLTPAGAPFENPADTKILYNDWPYGIDNDIVHLVVWTKFELEEDPATGDLSDQGRKQADDFVEATFRQRFRPDHVVWFKNWRSLKSVEAVEHFHVMLYQPEREIIAELTKNDMPLQEKIKLQEKE
ncbi:Hypothetical protein D9617_9g026170 [Elsinoe fawcettii]|nr:Hypothetical protein D9617_9g026170 [Elsinoe fawcettii]